MEIWDGATFNTLSFALQSDSCSLPRTGVSMVSSDGYVFYLFNIHTSFFYFCIQKVKRLTISNGSLKWLIYRFDLEIVDDL